MPASCCGERTDADRRPIEITLSALQVSVYRAVGDMPALVAEATELLARLTQVRFAEVPSLLQYRAIALDNKGVGLLWSGRPELAQRYLWAASTAAQAAGVELVEINAIGHLALLEAMCGSMTEAARLADHARDLAERRGWINALQSVAAHLALVLVHSNATSSTRRSEPSSRVSGRTAANPRRRSGWPGRAPRPRLALAQRRAATRPGGSCRTAQRQRDARMRAPALDRWLLLAESEADLTAGRPEQVEARFGEAGRPERARPWRSRSAGRGRRSRCAICSAPKICSPARPP